MANENKKINELVSIEEASAEVDARTARQADRETWQKTSLEADENTFELAEIGADTSVNAASNASANLSTSPSIKVLQKELHDRESMVERLQYDFEQVRAKWQGLQTELRSREVVSTRLQQDLRALTLQLAEAETALLQRDTTIEELKARERDQGRTIGNLEQLLDELRIAKANVESGDEITAARERLIEYEGAIAGLKAAFSGLQNQQQQTETYADKLRRELSDLRTESQSAVNERAALRVELRNAESTIASLEGRLLKASQAADEAQAALAMERSAHETEIRQLRFELAEAAETISESAEVSEQLASDLQSNRGDRLELEQRLSVAEQQGRDQVERLERELAQLRKTLAEYESQLASKSQTNQALMTELARRAQGDEQHIDDNVILGVSAPVDRVATGDRISRVLIGTIDNRELRFPLFKDRLTIGRTQQNDIYLKAQFISRRHAVIVSDGDRTRIIDWGSKNGVYINARRITEHFLQSGDKVTIGSVEFRYEEVPKRESS